MYVHLDGHWVPPLPRSRSTRLTSRVELNPNDGRAPDTYDALQNAVTGPVTTRGPARPAVPSKTVERGSDRLPRSENTTTGTYVDAEHFQTFNGLFPSNPQPAVWTRSLQAYQWADNSCFLDASLEVFFRAFTLWAPDVRQRFLNDILATELKDSPALVCKIYFHYQTRFRWILARSKDATPSPTFRLAQKSIREVIQKRWDIIEDGLGCASKWWLKVLEVRIVTIRFARFILVLCISCSLARDRSAARHKWQTTLPCGTTACSNVTADTVRPGRKGPYSFSIVSQSMIQSSHVWLQRANA